MRADNALISAMIWRQRHCIEAGQGKVREMVSLLTDAP